MCVRVCVCVIVQTTLQTSLTSCFVQLRRSPTHKMNMEQKVNTVTMSLAILEEYQGSSGPPLLLALCGDVNIKSYEHNLLLEGMNGSSRPVRSICWSSSSPFAAQFTQTNAAVLARRLRQHAVSNSRAPRPIKRGLRNFTFEVW